jgi:RimJ/RimL family protein N-acetyltransferase
MKGFYYILKGYDIMRANHVILNQEVTRSDALVIMNWMENQEITRYLNEISNIAHEIRQAIDRVNLTVMTHLFNREGSFFLINDEEQNPIGFLKLVRRMNEAEMVIVIGDQDKWGLGLGRLSILQGLNIAFFQWRISRVIAKIDKKNVRSVKAFEKAGFTCEKELSEHSLLFQITQDDYIRSII